MEVMMDRLRLDIAVTRLAKLQNLLDLACKEVLINILDGRIKGPQLVTVNLPTMLREHLMRVFEGKVCLPGHQSIEEFDRRYEAFKILLPARKIDLQALMSFCPIDSETRKSMFSKVMELIETKSPKVESLRIDLKRIISRECVLEISLLRDLKNLKKLDMPGCNIHLEDLMFLCREKIPTLQHVQVEIITISLTDFKNEENLLCPNLEVLKLQNVIVGDDTNFIFDFAKLKQLYWKPSTSKKAHLSHILAAPDLETLELFGNSFNWEAIENVSRLVSNGKILCKLVTFKYVGSRPQVPYLHNDDEQYTDFFSAMSKLIKNSMAFIPKLCDVSVFMCFGCMSWNNINEGRRIEDMTPDPSYCNCLTASVCKELKDETIFDFLEALNHRKKLLPRRGEF
ncbi:Hypothetical predicted protein [Cloeon dipterum]|uniref:FBD domain-containing protein n=1 Tax=Cloeon dipterum TaxID=197152 RepID=A0A8S1DNS3_9INSE|nr:Hypothetical predicted protein [Cloeon dipterum]